MKKVPKNEISEKTVSVKANQFIIEKIGLMPSIEDLIFDDEKNTWTVILKADYPRFYIDDKTKAKIFKYITLKPIGQIQIASTGEVIKFTPKDKMVENIYNMLSTFRANIESMLVKVTAGNLSQLKEALNVFEPMKIVLDKIYYDNKFMLSEISGLTDHERHKYAKYFPLLESLNVIKPIKGGYEATPHCREIQDSVEGFEEFKIKIVEIVLSEKYGTIRQIFNITRFEPFIHVSNSEYQPSIIAEKLLNFSEENLQSIHNEIFGSVNSFQFNKTLRELIHIKVLQRTDTDLITGFQPIFNNLIEHKEHFPMSII